MVQTTESESSLAPVKYFILKLVSLKYFYIICLVLFLGFAVFKNKYSPRLYETSASIDPVENKTSSLLSSNQLFGGLESLQSLTNIENEMNNLNSFALVYKTIVGMNLEVSYFREKSGLFKQTYELYLQSPITVTIDKSHVQPIESIFFIKVIDNSSFRLTASQKKVSCYNYLDNLIISNNNILEIDTICKFNETISNKLFKFSASLNKDYQFGKSESEYQYYFKFRHLDYLA
jgi:hypothetical protein